MQLCSRNISFAFIQHFDVAAQGDGGHAVLGTLSIAPAKERLPKTNREAQHLHPAAPGHPKMAVLVHRHQNSEGTQGQDDGIKKIH